MSGCVKQELPDSLLHFPEPNPRWFELQNKNGGGVIVKGKRHNNPKIWEKWKTDSWTWGVGEDDNNEKHGKHEALRASIRAEIRTICSDMKTQLNNFHETPPFYTAIHSGNSETDKLSNCTYCTLWNKRVHVDQQASVGCSLCLLIYFNSSIHSTVLRQYDTNTFIDPIGYYNSG